MIALKVAKEKKYHVIIPLSCISHCCHSGKLYNTQKTLVSSKKFHERESIITVYINNLLAGFHPQICIVWFTSISLENTFPLGTKLEIQSLIWSQFGCVLFCRLDEKKRKFQYPKPKSQLWNQIWIQFQDKQSFKLIFGFSQTFNTQSCLHFKYRKNHFPIFSFSP